MGRGRLGGIWGGLIPPPRPRRYRQRLKVTGGRAPPGTAPVAGGDDTDTAGVGVSPGGPRFPVPAARHLPEGRRGRCRYRSGAGTGAERSGGPAALSHRAASRAAGRGGPSGGGRYRGTGTGTRNRHRGTGTGTGNRYQLRERGAGNGITPPAWGGPVSLVRPPQDHLDAASCCPQHPCPSRRRPPPMPG